VADLIVPACDPFRRRPHPQPCRPRAFEQFSSRRVATSGIITSGPGLHRPARRRRRPPRRSRGPAFRRFPGKVIPRRQPRDPDGIEFVEFGGAALQRVDADPDGLDSSRTRHPGVPGQEFVQRGIEQADRHRQPAMTRRSRGNPRRCSGSSLARARRRPALVLGQDHLAARRRDGLSSKNICWCGTGDTFRAELARDAAVSRGFGVVRTFMRRCFIGPDHQRAKIADQFRLDRLDQSGHDIAVCHQA